jgi:N-acetylglucosamine-6-phosphate deacetylase
MIASAIPGFHLEGPYISVVDGPRGAHPKDYAREPSWDEFERLQDAAAGLIKLVTVAPELPGAISFIEKLREEGIIPAIGHTNAETEDIEAASLAGAALSTHLGNGAHAHIRRHPNYLWDQLANDNLWASLIVDGFHLPANVVKVMTRAKGLEKIILVTDAVTVAGLAPGTYSFMGKDVELRPEGVVKLSGTDYLAGAALTMPEAIFNITRFADLEQQAAIDMASQQPYDLLSGIAGISRDIFNNQNFTLLSWDENSLEVIATIVDGQVRFSKFADQAAGEQS